MMVAGSVSLPVYFMHDVPIWVEKLLNGEESILGALDYSKIVHVYV